MGAIPDSVVGSIPALALYTKKRLRVAADHYFNAGVLLMNLDAMRKCDFLNVFLRLLQSVTFQIAQDQDYLNVICKNRVEYVGFEWNTMPCDVHTNAPKLIHYNLDFKPWHRDDVAFGDVFWDYAERSGYPGGNPQDSGGLHRMAHRPLRRGDHASDRHGQKAGQKADGKYADPLEDQAGGERMTSQEIPKSPERLAILEKIAQYEREGRFDEDVENDPPSRVLLPEEIEYADRRFSAECRRTAAFGAAYLYFWNLRRKKEIILCKTEGLEHLAGVKGAVITCNHFHPMDSFIMQKVFDASKHPKRMYRVIREGNYTSFPGFYGFLMRSCNTLPLSSNMQTMKKFLRAVDQVLSEGNCLLIYPEQSMWWNYRKPKPLKPGAFDMALKNHVPVVPCFITMADSDLVGADGFPVQEYTPHLGAPIWPDETLSRPAAREQLRQKTEDFCRETYETVYGVPLRYETRES